MFVLFLVFLVAQSIAGYRTTSQLRVWSGLAGREAAAMLERYMSRYSRGESCGTTRSCVVDSQGQSARVRSSASSSRGTGRRSRSTHGKPSSARSMPDQAPGWCMARAARWAVCLAAPPSGRRSQADHRAFRTWTRRRPEGSRLGEG